MSTETTRISPTAHYTAFVWYRYGLSDQALATLPGRLFYHALRPFNAAASKLGEGISLEKVLLQRHHIIDDLLSKAVQDGGLQQVMEVASGLSPRGFTTARRFAEQGLLYVEGDLPPMARQKERLLLKAGLLRENHKILPLNALSTEGPLCLGQVASEHLRPQRNTAIITEGLLSYFDRPTVLQMLRQFVDLLRSQSGGVFLSDLHLQSDRPDMALVTLFQRGLELFARGKTHLHFRDEQEVIQVLKEIGFDDVVIHRPSTYVFTSDAPLLKQPDVVRVLEARIGPEQV